MAKQVIKAIKPLSSPKKAGKKTLISESTSELTFEGIDGEFLKLIYFISEKEKMVYLDSINKLLNTIGIKIGDDIVEVRNKLSNYSIENEDLNIDFLMDVLKVRDITYYKDFDDESDIPSNIESAELKENSRHKILGFYNGLRFGITNIKRKLENKFYDISFEENIILKEIKKDERISTVTNSEVHQNYILLDAYYHLGLAYFMSGNEDKSSKYFSLIKDTKWQLSEYSVGDFYKKIGELYLSNNDNKNALKWFELGIKINPKLSVKKHINKLKNSI